MLVKRGAERVKPRDVVDNRWMNLMPFSPSRMQQWTDEMRVEALRADLRGAGANAGADLRGAIVGLRGADPSIYALDSLESVCSIVPAFDQFKPDLQELLDNNLQYKYFKHLARKFLGAGYVDGNDLVAAPYDFRLMLDPPTRTVFFEALQKKIEAATLVRGLPAVVVAHSLGALVVAWFLGTHVDEGWRAAHVAKFISVNGPYGGTPLALRALLCGEYYLSGFEREFREGLQLNSGILMSLPNRVGYGDGVPLTPALTVGDLYDWHEPAAAEAMEAWRSLYDPRLLSVHTGIPVDVVVSEGVETMTTFALDGTTLTTAEGDGLVTVAGQNAAFELLQGPRVARRVLESTNHRSIVSDPRFIRYVLDECAAVGK